MTANDVVWLAWAFVETCGGIAVLRIVWWLTADQPRNEVR